jgi:hypothetical protein
MGGGVGSFTATRGGVASARGAGFRSVVAGFVVAKERNDMGRGGVSPRGGFVERLVILPEMGKALRLRNSPLYPKCR